MASRARDDQPVAVPASGAHFSQDHDIRLDVAVRTSLGPPRLVAGLGVPCGREGGGNGGLCSPPMASGSPSSTPRPATGSWSRSPPPTSPKPHTRTAGRASSYDPHIGDYAVGARLPRAA